MRHPAMNRRSALKLMAGGLAFPYISRGNAAPPSETLRHASCGASGMAWADIQSLTASPHVKLVAVADVDLNRTAEVKGRFPGVRVYQDYRELLDKEKALDSVNISTPDHMHAAITMRAMERGLNVYTQKPLAQTIFEARQLARVAREKGLVTQMGIQIHSHPVHKAVVAIIQGGAIGKVKEVHSWSGKKWGDTAPRPERVDQVPAGLDWDGWLGVAAARPFIRGWYHPGEWRKRLDFGTGTFGDMGCHILDPVFGSLGLTAPNEVLSTGGAPNQHSWGLDSVVRYTFPATPHTAEKPALTWYDGDRRPPAEVTALIGRRELSDQGSLYIGTEGVLYSPYIDDPVLLPADKFAGYKAPQPEGDDHYLQFVEACRGNGKTSAPFSYAGPLTEMVLLGCLSTRFPGKALAWDADALKVTNLPEANRFVRREYRQGYDAPGLARS
ncbi:putative oxidoreductase YvaA [Aquisphaera giovannonii]|uniref:Putative oxidoreductase YvaA n=1 Tax=Aquisphaera giovannonii TaxID=406548 RepID=A0A5B9WAF1_9BACT|nr:Gfo/Idh/MocA family oxidoreductase [Aquisphaera giovannonii]QEH37618.1 putative oxidoreductase YvaA [Aquisphaera giovannonii]